MQRLILLRHAHAGDPEKYKKAIGGPDSLRPVSPKGHKQMKWIIKSLKREVSNINELISSPYTRARETAEHVRKAYKKLSIRIDTSLVPTVSIEKTWAELSILNSKTVVIVGHNPHFNKLLNYILTRSTKEIFDIQKGGYAILEFDQNFRNSQARLICLVKPKKS